MEEKNIVLLNEEESYVKVEENKKRQKERTVKIFKRAIILLVLLASVIIVIRFLPQIKGLWNNIFDNNQGITNTDTSQSTDKNEGNLNQGQGGGQAGGNQQEAQDALPNGAYQIKDIGAQEYKATNESGCEFDFSLKPTLTSLAEIYKKYGNEAPVVLITHSHTRQTYSNGKYYSPSDNFYSDTNTVGDIGEIICQKLNDLGVNAIHLNELYASGSIINSSEEYENSLSDTLKRYPSIAYVFNISRGIYINDDLTMQKSAVDSNNTKLAQISVISGTSWDKASENQVQNVLFGFDLASFINSNVDLLVGENKISRFELCQNISPICANIEIGAFSNSFDEAKQSAIIFSTLFYEYLNKSA